MASESQDHTVSEGDEPLTSPRSVQSETNFDIAPLPVVCIRRDGSSSERIPAIKANHPSVGVAVFPLNRIELGDIWYGKAKLSKWDIRPIAGGWDKAYQRFCELIRYPHEFLSPLLGVLHQQKYLDQSPLRWTQWAVDCKNTSPKLYAVSDCRVCGTPRCLSMRLLNEVNRTLDSFQCKSVGEECGGETKGKRLHDTYDELPLTAGEGVSLLGPTKVPRSTRYYTARERDTGTPGIGHPSLEVPETIAESPDIRQDPYSRKVPGTDPRLRTIYPAYRNPDTHDFCTWSDIHKRHRRHRHKKACTDSEDSDSEDERDTLNDTLATPQPKNFLHGTLAKRLRKPDPTTRQLDEYWALKGTKEWRDTKYSFIKWINSNKELRFAGTPSVAHFVEWNRTMRTHFKDCDICNPICQFEVATTSFTKNARSWWDAHSVKRPSLLVTYEQLLEWIRHELVPDSNPALAYMEWNTLRYRGNVEEYMKQIERLMEYFPIQRDTMIACLARPISTEFAAELRNMDIQLEGMSNPKLKEVIKNHLISTRGHYSSKTPLSDRHPSRFDPDRRLLSVDPRTPRCLPSSSSQRSASPSTSTFPTPKTPRVHTKPFPQLPADPSHTYLAAKYGEGPTPCYVCGNKDHGWVQCVKKKRGKCGVCGSEAHWTRYCRQRYRPAPQARLNYQAICLEALTNPDIHLVNAPFDSYDSDVEGGICQQLDQDDPISEDEGQDLPIPGVSLCQVALPLPRKIQPSPLTPSEEVRSAVQLLGRDGMERWQHFLKKICVDATTSIFPVASPTLRGQLLYRISIEHTSVVALLDHGLAIALCQKNGQPKTTFP